MTASLSCCLCKKSLIAAALQWQKYLWLSSHNIFVSRRISHDDDDGSEAVKKVSDDDVGASPFSVLIVVRVVIIARFMLLFFSLLIFSTFFWHKHTQISCLKLQRTTTTTTCCTSLPTSTSLHCNTIALMLRNVINNSTFPLCFWASLPPSSPCVCETEWWKFDSNQLSSWQWIFDIFSLLLALTPCRIYFRNCYILHLFPSSVAIIICCCCRSSSSSTCVASPFTRKKQIWNIEMMRTKKQQAKSSRFNE